MMSAKPLMSSPSPWMTVADPVRDPVPASRDQFIFTTLGTTASSGKASAASAASSACAVLPRPGSSASRNVRWPSAADCDHLGLVLHQLQRPGQHHLARLGQRHGGGGAVADLLEGAEQRPEQLPAGEPAGLAAVLRDGGEVRRQERVGRAVGRAPTAGRRGARRRAGTARRSDSSSSSTSTPARSSMARRISEAWSETLAVSDRRVKNDGSRRPSGRGSWRCRRAA